MKVLPTSRRLVARIAVTGIVLSLTATSFASAAEAAITRPFEASSRLELAPGVDYAKGTMRTTGGRKQSVNVATVDPMVEGVYLKSVLSNNKVVRREVVSRMGIRTTRPGRRAMVATNGDMSTRDRVDAYAAPQSMAVSDGELLLAQACTRPSFGVDADGSARIGEVRANVSVKLPGRVVEKRIHRVNTHRDDGHVVLFTSRFASSTRTAPGGIEVVTDMEDILRPNGSQQLKVVEVRRGAGNTSLRADQAVISVKNATAKWADWVYELRVGDRLQVTTTVVRKVDSRCGGIIEPAPGWSDIVEALGGNHFTLRGGKIAAPSLSVYRAGSQRHPRTGVGVTEDGRVLMVTVDGRQSHSVGVTLAEMGQLMRSLGAVHAFNLDGGGSTVMARRNLRSGEFVVANKPSDGRQRPATQALVAFEVGNP